VRLLNDRKNYPRHANTWEPLENLDGCGQLLDAYNRRAKNGVPDESEVDSPDEPEDSSPPKKKSKKGKGKEVVTRGEGKEDKVVPKTAKGKEKADESKTAPEKGKGKATAGVKPVEKGKGKEKEDNGKGKVGFEGRFRSKVYLTVTTELHVTTYEHWRTFLGPQPTLPNPTGGYSLLFRPF
jgi:hypothetical protein